MLKFISILVAAMLLPFTQVEAREWNISVPGWIDTLSETLSVTDRSAHEKREITCIALAVYYESRGESVRGQRAVASVVMNRVRDPRFPDTACEVLMQNKQFSFMNNRPVLRPTGASWDRAIEIASEFVNRSTGEVPYLFFSSESYLKGYRIGAHVFR